MSGLSTTYDNLVINNLFVGTALATPTKYIGLFKSAAGLTNNNQAEWEEIETTIGGVASAYERPLVANGSWTNAVNGVTRVVDNAAFNVATADWGQVSHVAVLDAATAGNVIAWGVLRNPATEAEQPREVLAGDQFIIRENSLVFSLNDNPLI